MRAPARVPWAGAPAIDGVPDAPPVAAAPAPAVDATSRLSPDLRWGCVHPASSWPASAGARAPTFRTELCWREFYADVLFHRLDGRLAHRPGERPGGPPPGDPAPVVDHADERREALRRNDEIRYGP